MSYLSPIECNQSLSALSILKKLLKKDSDGNFYIGSHGLSTSCDTLEDGVDMWKICCGDGGEFEIYYKDTIWTLVWEGEP